MAGEDAFEVAAAVAAISGLAALLVMSLLAVVGTWRLFVHASETSVATARAVVALEDLARRLASPGPVLAYAGPAANPSLQEAGQMTDIGQQIAGLAEQQRQLQEMARNLLDTVALSAAPVAPELDDLELTVNRLDTTVGQMAASLANLIQILERERR